MSRKDHIKICVVLFSLGTITAALFVAVTGASTNWLVIPGYGLLIMTLPYGFWVADKQFKILVKTMWPVWSSIFPWMEATRKH
ncbi:MAG: hypothetical protein OXD48_06810, partial [Litoreibacter sp.]|nr:hypothetical protein [Litoreibacter sp.]